MDKGTTFLSYFNIEFVIGKTVHDQNVSNYKNYSEEEKKRKIWSCGSRNKIWYYWKKIEKKIELK